MSAHTLDMNGRHQYKCINPDHEGEPCHGVTFRSVTTILGDAVPKDLSWHGMVQGVYGIKRLSEVRRYNVSSLTDERAIELCRDQGVRTNSADAAREWLREARKYRLEDMSGEALVDALRREKLTVNDHLREAGKGGTAVHRALEGYVKTGAIPSARDIPHSKRSSIKGIARFVVDYKPEFVESEVRVLSVEHGFAGTFDLLARLRVVEQKIDGNVCFVPHPNAAPSVGLVDLKSTKWVYPASHFPQLEAYEHARLEEGGKPSDFRAVLWINPRGEMRLVKSTATFDDFLTLKASAATIGRLEKSWRRPKVKR